MKRIYVTHVIQGTSISKKEKEPKVPHYLVPKGMGNPEELLLPLTADSTKFGGQ